MAETKPPQLGANHITAGIGMNQDGSDRVTPDAGFNQPGQKHVGLGAGPNQVGADLISAVTAFSHPGRDDSEVTKGWVRERAKKS